MEINDLSIVTATAVDKVAGNYFRLSLQIAVPVSPGASGGPSSSGTSGQNLSTVTVSEQGETIMDAYRRLQLKLPRKLFFSHSRVLIVGEKLAREGVAPVLDFFSRYRESRLRNYVIVTKGEAAKILRVTPTWERISAEELREEEKARTGVAVFLKDFYDKLLSDGIEPVTSSVEIRKGEVGSGGDSNSKGAASPRDHLAVNGTAVFRDDKLIGWMNTSETRGMLWMLNMLKTSVLTAHIPKEKGGGKIGVYILQAHTEIKPVLSGGKVTMHINAHATDELYENDSRLDLSKPENVTYVEQKLEEILKARLRLTINKAQKEFKSDIFGFGQAVYRSYPRQWNKQIKEQWNDEFPRVETVIHTKVTVIRTGLTNKSMTQK